MYTVAEIASRFRVARATVELWIEQNKLAAISASRPGSKRRTYRVSEESLNAFLRSREVRKLPVSTEKDCETANFPNYLS